MLKKEHKRYNLLNVQSQLSFFYLGLQWELLCSRLSDLIASDLSWTDCAFLLINVKLAFLLFLCNRNHCIFCFRIVIPTEKDNKSRSKWSHDNYTFRHLLNKNILYKLYHRVCYSSLLVLLCSVFHFISSESQQHVTEF